MSVILLVENVESLRLETAEALREMGHRVVEAEDDAAAMTALRNGSFDVLFIEASLPGTSGEVFAAEACAGRPALRVVFGTGKPRFATRAAPEGPHILCRPYTTAALRAVLGDGPPPKFKRPPTP